MDLDTRMKLYEGLYDTNLLPGVPILARVDGRAFHRFTADMDRPFDDLFVALMTQTALYLLKYTNALLVYVQSDEISLLWHAPENPASIFWNGRVNKMVSDLAASATRHFNHLLRYHLKLYERMPTFDARVWAVPSPEEAANYFLWREQDALRNSVSMAASAYYTASELHGCNNGVMHEMLYRKGVNWNDYAPHNKRGAFYRKAIERHVFSTAELSELPPLHEAHTNPALSYDRAIYVQAYEEGFGKLPASERIKLCAGNEST